MNLFSQGLKEVLTTNGRYSSWLQVKKTQNRRKMSPDKPFSVYQGCFRSGFFWCPIICECLRIRQKGPVENVCAVLAEV